MPTLLNFIRIRYKMMAELFCF